MHGFYNITNTFLFNIQALRLEQSTTFNHLSIGFLTLYYHLWEDGRPQM